MVDEIGKTLGRVLSSIVRKDGRRIDRMIIESNLGVRSGRARHFSTKRSFRDSCLLFVSTKATIIRCTVAFLLLWHIIHHIALF